VADLTGDGDLEIIIGRAGDQVTVYNHLGGVEWTRNPFGSGEVRTLAVEDLENDGQLEVIAGRASGGETQQVIVFEFGGAVRPMSCACGVTMATHDWRQRTRLPCSS
jgi:hypothetical protein